jgi:hypothetical protein
MLLELGIHAIFKPLFQLLSLSPNSLTGSVTGVTFRAVTSYQNHLLWPTTAQNHGVHKRSCTLIRPPPLCGSTLLRLKVWARAVTHLQLLRLLLPQRDLLKPCSELLQRS